MSERRLALTIACVVFATASWLCAFVSFQESSWSHASKTGDTFGFLAISFGIFGVAAGIGACMPEETK